MNLPYSITRRIENISHIPRNILLLPDSTRVMLSLDKEKLVQGLFTNKREYLEARWFHLQFGFYIHIMILLSTDSTPILITNGIALSEIILTQLASSQGLNRLIRLITLDKVGSVIK